MALPYNDPNSLIARIKGADGFSTMPRGRNWQGAALGLQTTGAPIGSSANTVTTKIHVEAPTLLRIEGLAGVGSPSDAWRVFWSADGGTITGVNELQCMPGIGPYVFFPSRGDYLIGVCGVSAFAGIGQLVTGTMWEGIDPDFAYVLINSNKPGWTQPTVGYAVGPASSIIIDNTPVALFPSYMRWHCIKISNTGAGAVFYALGLPAAVAPSALNGHPIQPGQSDKIEASDFNVVGNITVFSTAGSTIAVTQSFR